MTELAASTTSLAAAGPWTSIGVQGFAAGRFGAAATAAEYGIAAYGTAAYGATADGTTEHGSTAGGTAGQGMGARDGTDLAVRMLAAGLVLGPRAVPDAIGRCRDLLRTVPGETGDLRAALAILLAMSGRYESARDALAGRPGPTGRGDPGGSRDLAGSADGRVAAAAVEHLAGRWDAVGPALRGRGRPAGGLPPRGLNLLARSLLAQGLIDAADDLLRRGSAVPPGAGGPRAAPPWPAMTGPAPLGPASLGPVTLADRCGIAARVLAARGRAACALLLAHAAVATAERTDSTGGQGLAYLDLAHTYLALGDGRAARAAARDARQSFARKEHLVGVARADQLLSTTSG